MAEFIQNNIKFTADNSTLSKAGQKTVKFGNIENDNFDPELLEVIGGVAHFVNAVKIDWNGSEVEECLLIQVGESRCSMIVPSIAA